MNTTQQTIRKAVGIHAPKEKVWDVLLNDNYTRIWYAEFSEGTYVETDWKVGSKTAFKDSSGNGIVGKVVENKPYEILSIEFEGIVTEGKEDYESLGAQQVNGAHETYILTETEGIVMLSIESDMSEKYVETMSVAWDRALQKIKDLSEKA